MLSKYEIEQLVSEGAGEQELQAEIKKDLSIMAEVYARPKDEFIAFSEFPIGDGCVDFAIFTSRSRMEIILIEVKGADFSFSNKDGSIAADINFATQQMGARFYSIRSNYESLRRNVHQIRLSVEAGNQRYNSLLSPKGYLLVDPNKDVNFRGVVIGGRTRDDHLESRLKTQMGLNGSSQIKHESWDSWLRRLTRT
jgi:hypothetical protein